VIIEPTPARSTRDCDTATPMNPPITRASAYPMSARCRVVPRPSMITSKLSNSDSNTGTGPGKT
jgi:hypothetical protein